MTDKLEGQAREDALAELAKTGWAQPQDRDAIYKKFEFSDFRAAFGWMTQMALYAERWDHHPEWANMYKTVHVVLTTHSAGGLSDLDIRMARKMDETAS